MGGINGLSFPYVVLGWPCSIFLLLTCFCQDSSSKEGEYDWSVFGYLSSLCWGCGGSCDWQPHLNHGEWEKGSSPGVDKRESLCSLMSAGKFAYYRMAIVGFCPTGNEKEKGLGSVISSLKRVGHHCRGISRFARVVSPSKTPNLFGPWLF